MSTANFLLGHLVRKSTTFPFLQIGDSTVAPPANATGQMDTRFVYLICQECVRIKDNSESYNAIATLQTSILLKLFLTFSESEEVYCALEYCLWTPWNSTSPIDTKATGYPKKYIDI